MDGEGYYEKANKKSPKSDVSIIFYNFSNLSLKMYFKGYAVSNGFPYHHGQGPKMALTFSGA